MKRSGTVVVVVIVIEKTRPFGHKELDLSRLSVDHVAWADAPAKRWPRNQEWREEPTAYRDCDDDYDYDNDNEKEGLDASLIYGQAPVKMPS